MLLWNFRQRILCDVAKDRWRSKVSNARAKQTRERGAKSVWSGSEMKACCTTEEEKEEEKNAFDQNHSIS